MKKFLIPIITLMVLCFMCTKPVEKDTTPPTVSILSPANNYETGEDSSIWIRIEAQDEHGILLVQAYIDGIKVLERVDKPYETLWSGSGKPGSHLVRAYANDAYGNRGESNPVTFTVIPKILDYKPLAFFTISPPIGDTSTMFSFDATGSTDRETASEQLEVRWDWENDGSWDTDYSPEKVASHQYSNAGTFLIRLEVKDDGGLTSRVTKQLFVTSNGTDGYETFDYNGRIYAYKTIGTQTWMIENLAWLPAVSPSTEGSNTDKHYYVYGYEGNRVGEAMGEPNYTIYGVLYNWEAALTACPDGWRLPSEKDWNQLTEFLVKKGYGHDGDGIDIAKSLASTFGWYYDDVPGNVGYDQSTNNSSGFSALPGGYRYFGGGFDLLGEFSYFWSSQGEGTVYAWDRCLYYNFAEVSRKFFNRSYGFSVRCLKK